MDDASIGPPAHQINDKSLISVGVVGLILGGVTTAVFYFAAVSTKEEALKERLDALEAQQRVYIQTVQSVDNRLANIEGFMRAQDNRKRHE